MTFHWQEMPKTSKEGHGTKKCSKLNYAKYKTLDKQREKVRFKDDNDFDPDFDPKMVKNQERKELWCVEDPHGT